MSGQLIIDCGLNNNVACRLDTSKAGISAIQLQTRPLSGQYHYYLQINNHWAENCQVSMLILPDLQTYLPDEQTNEEFLSAINFKLSAHETVLFNDSLRQALNQQIELSSLPAHSIQLYRLDWDVKKNIQPAVFNFSLDFKFDCQMLEKLEEEKTLNAGQVLAEQTEAVEQNTKKNHDASLKNYVAIIITFALFFTILFLFAAKLLTSSKERKSHEPEKKS